MRRCTRCNEEIKKKQKYYTTKKGSHHEVCEHKTDGTPCWCDTVREDYRKEIKK